jgi:hypothetical protein
MNARSVWLTLAPSSSLPAGLSREEHVLLAYNPDNIWMDGRRINPPALRRMSGGGVFRFQRQQPETIKLVGILIEYHRSERVIAGTRIASVARMARDIIERLPGDFF